MIPEEIRSPTLLVDEQKCRANIERMVDKANRFRMELKPHFKTHQSAQVGEWFREYGITSIVVSSLGMANYFANHGWKDITIAFPVNIREIEAVNDLAGRVQQLSLFVNDIKSATTLSEQLTNQISVYVEIDTGSQRSGLLPEQTEEIARLLALFDATNLLLFKGFYSHPGHSYIAGSKDEIKKIHTDVLSKMNKLKDNFPDAYLCIGDTPCCSIAEHFDGIDQISPGNFIFYDLMQVQIGSCRIDDIAVALAAPVVAKYPERRELILHSGAVHLSKELLQWEGKQIYGLPVYITGEKWTAPIQDSYVCSLSQEHGILKCNPKLFQSMDIGDMIGILPVHSCLTANLMDSTIHFNQST